ncbi:MULTISPECIES: transposase [unclassified Neorhizobium]|uniref:transposase n=1 Tax=unclassified Neorhizobium TaxID=2629175 RepID=UPI001FF69573|nr:MULTISPECIES: transposase [unclassified Neorhizobium]MCJ9668508.1 transposase [Neorhizobium sp. SHOUNA12B]MCJ9743961.1 transposase [Neorhizobium sp. SHOUNA12A]
MSRLIFIDETSTNTRLTKRTGWSRKGNRVVAYAPFGKWKAQTFIAGLRCHGLTAPFIVDAPMNSRIFETWIDALYEWTRLPMTRPNEDGFRRWLLARRSLRNPDAIAYYFANAPAETTLAELAAAAGLRWTIEECFLRAKDDLGLDHCEARSWHGWHRHMSLVMAAAAFLVKVSAQQRRHAFGKWNETSPDDRVGAAA